MKRKWNVLDTVIVVIALAVVVGICYFLFRPTDDTVIPNNETEYYVSFETAKAKKGTYDLIREGDAIFTVDDGKQFGIIEKVEILPNRTAVFNETTKQYSVSENAEYPVCRVTVKTTGYKNDVGEIFANGRSVVMDDEWFMETKVFRFAGNVIAAKGADEK